MITTHILENNVWSSIQDADFGRGENSLVNLAEEGRAAMAAHWGIGDDMDEQLASIGGDVTLDVTETSDDEIIATARSADGKHSATIRVTR
jgi:hypothetical protein